MLWTWWMACSSIHSASDAPFALEKIRASLWAVDEAQAFSTAILLLSSERVDCNEVEGKTGQEVLDSTAVAGTGLLFVLSADVPGSALDWAGTYTAYGAYSPDADGDGYRELYVAGVQDGWLYENYDETSWLRIDEIDGERVRGEFWHPWWWGKVKADVCGTWEGTDYGTYYYTY